MLSESFFFFRPLEATECTLDLRPQFLGKEVFKNFAEYIIYDILNFESFQIRRKTFKVPP